MGHFDGITEMTPILAYDNLALVWDLVIERRISNGGGNVGQSFVVLEGSASRRMFAPYRLLRDSRDGARRSVVHADIAGFATPAANGGEAWKGIAALIRRADDAFVVPDDADEFWMIEADANGVLDPTPSALATLRDLCNSGCPLRLPCTHAVSPKMSTDGNAVTLFVAEEPTCVASRPDECKDPPRIVEIRATRNDATFAVACRASSIGNGGASLILRMDAEDLDGDGLEELLWSSGGAMPQQLGGVAKIRGTLALGLEPPRIVPVPNSVTAFSVAAIDLDDAPGRELAMLTTDGIFRAHVRDTTTELEPERLVEANLDGGALYAVDANGDRLEDLIVVDGTRLVVFLRKTCTAEGVADGTCARPDPSN